MGGCVLAGPRIGWPDRRFFRVPGTPAGTARARGPSMHIDPDRLRDTLNALAKVELAHTELDEVLIQTVEATATLFNVAHAGVMLVDEANVLRYVAATDDNAR